MSVERVGRHERTDYPATGQMVGQLALFGLTRWQEICLQIKSAKIELEAIPQHERDAMEAAFEAAEAEGAYISSGGPGSQ